MGRIVRRLTLVAALAALVVGAASSNADAFNPERTTVKAAVNAEYWDLVRFWKPILTYHGYRFTNPTVDYYNYYANGRLVDYMTPCFSTANQHGSYGFYCNTGNMYFDLLQQRRILGNFGDGAVGLWVAHEFAHHIQVLSGVRRPAPRHELQADCFAGMYFRYGINHSGLLNYRDYLEARNNIWRAGGDAAHGTGNQRLAAFDYGFSQFNWSSCLSAY